ncbi:uncharacterized protein [Typha latifolia]|uniref:uncharacterized protein isoform X1 n=1 Tax=Typha latifolia TaxID=4733 RepID=UPI003C2BA1C3
MAVTPPQAWIDFVGYGANEVSEEALGFASLQYQRVSPEFLSLTNGRKPTILKTYEGDDAVNAAALTPNYTPIEAKPIIRARSTATASANPSSTRDLHFSLPCAENPTPIALSVSTTTQQNGKHHEINGGGGDLLLQWGHNKRSRRSRSEIRAAGDNPSTTNGKRTIKIRRRPTAEKVMPPPPPPCGSYTRGANLRPCLPSRDPPLFHHRAVEDRSSGHPRSEKRSPPSPPQRAMSTEAKPPPPPDLDPAAEKAHQEPLEWPRIYISLSRKEKEEDFLAMKGTKIPQRPKKRAKNIDKTLQYCFPGMWLSDLTRGRYEVREKKCVKKRRRGLKGMESIMDSDSD